MKEETEFIKINKVNKLRIKDTIYIVFNGSDNNKYCVFLTPEEITALIKKLTELLRKGEKNANA